jgi:GNAT superfamily N-acetyltransferase
MAMKLQARDTGVKNAFQIDATIDGKPAGYIKVHKARKKVKGRTVWTPQNVHVEADMRRKRVATKLYEAAAQEVCKRRGSLASLERNAGAHSLDFWLKQEHKGRAERVRRPREYGSATNGPDMYDAFILDCDHAEDLGRLAMDQNPLLWGGVALLVLGLASKAQAAVMRPSAPSGSRTIRYPGGSYTLTSTDLLWLKRALVGEVLRQDDATRVAQVLFNRYAYLRSRGTTAYPTFTSFVRAYAQPINPIWMSASGKGCQRSPGRCTPAILVRRAEHARRTSFPAWVDAAIARALTRGPVDIPASATHYAGYNVRSNMTQLTPHTRGYNTLWTEGAQTRWQGYSV